METVNIDNVLFFYRGPEKDGQDGLGCGVAGKF